MKRPCRMAALLPLDLEYSGRLLAGAIQYVNKHRRLSLIDIPYFVDNPNALKLRGPIGFDGALICTTCSGPPRFGAGTTPSGCAFAKPQLQ
ncbi:MAG: hypothetical protein ACKV19_18675 [Verrucomicrobiales bacterium]